MSNAFTVSAETTGLYPLIEPSASGFLAVDAGHDLYWEVCGNPRGIPALFLHGGPGGGCSATSRRFFDPSHYRIILFDQRGCGQSVPLGGLSDNTTAHLVGDMEQLRRHLQIERWVLFGGSWGSTLSLAYALAHMDRVAGMILRGVFLGSRAEVDWFLNGVRTFVPEAWAEFSRGANLPLVQHYCRETDDARPDVARAAAQRWSDYETRVMEPASAAMTERTTVPAGSVAQDLLPRVRVQLHFMVHDFFLRPNELLDNLWRIGSKPVIIVQGRLDMVCPPVTATAVAEGIDGCELQMVASGGHSALGPEIAARLCAATQLMRARIGV